MIHRVLTVRPDDPLEATADRGVYEWDGAESAEAYARALWRVLELVSVKGSIHYQVALGLRRDELLADPHVLDPVEPAGKGAWWRMVGTL